MASGQGNHALTLEIIVHSICFLHTHLCVQVLLLRHLIGFSDGKSNCFWDQQTGKGWKRMEKAKTTEEKPSKNSGIWWHTRYWSKSLLVSIVSCVHMCTLGIQTNWRLKRKHCRISKPTKHSMLGSTRNLTTDQTTGLNKVVTNPTWYSSVLITIRNCPLIDQDERQLGIQYFELADVCTWSFFLSVFPYGCFQK